MCVISYSTVYTVDRYVLILYVFTCTQGDTGLVTVEVDGQKENPLVTSLGENWRKRRHTLTPAFSTHKMRLVGGGWG